MFGQVGVSIENRWVVQTRVCEPIHNVRAYAKFIEAISQFRKVDPSIKGLIMREGERVKDFPRIYYQIIMRDFV